MEEFLKQIQVLCGAYVLNVGGAVAFLICGWIAAGVVAGIVRAGFGKTGLDARLEKYTGQSGQLSHLAGLAAYYTVLLLVWIGVFQALRLNGLTQPLNALLSQVLSFLPRLVSLGILLFVASLLARVCRNVVGQSLRRGKFDALFPATPEGATGPSVIAGEIAYYVVLLLFLPGLLDIVSLGGLLAPVQQFLGKALGFVPNLVGAAMVATGLATTT